ncbi:LytR/AlgR family response regulator transcription factor [Marinobacter caseinilyticus]|uniref:LytR/AlgR family response regulator transcription factor n=1 Tax=Marinobacter caseinilyticus TaxID=2692195 RepID=UPI00140BD909|nr:LytTR family DNA-binding domain-containing protein [Marinobacter caseinilyticus]
MIEPTHQTVLIADDEPLARERIRRLVEALPNYRVCGEAGDGDKTLSAIAEHEPDIVLLDIRMPGMDGLEVAEKLNTLSSPPAIIFCTAYDHYAITAFEVQAIAYLLKPVRREALGEALARAGRVNRVQLRALGSRAKTGSDQLAVKTHRGTELIELNSIHYCEADQKCVTLHHAGGETVTDFTLKELESRYAQDLLRIHRHTLVGARFIQSLVRSSEGHYHIVLKNVARQLAVSRRHSAAVRQWLNEHQPG